MLARDCKTADDVMLYLVSNLKIVDEEVKVDEWQQKMGFHEYCFVAQVWFNHESKEWGYHVGDDEFNGIPNMGIYSGFTEMLNGVVKVYTRLWNLT